MVDENPCSTPMEFSLKLAKQPKESKVNSSIDRSLLDSLMYLSTTQPYIMFTVETPRLIAYSDNNYGEGLSSNEAEYMSITIDGCQALWMRGILKELKHPQKKPTVIYCDDKSAIALTKNIVYHGKSKHARIKYSFIGELVSYGEVEVIFCKSCDQATDVLNKALKIADFVKMKDGVDGNCLECIEQRQT
ncbi:hypothetical protein OSB04_un001872 [Centaurea solstitialis]|uniref:Uncharacterized protein n=1 Tax=Centaurea solstitialis TaxID=347529 RepID=A0AA38W4N6_9ASTR|nr:hypothetical protein OSB04_un001872 [Centaurea solstitialis]